MLRTTVSQPVIEFQLYRVSAVPAGAEFSGVPGRRTTFISRDPPLTYTALGSESEYSVSLV